MVVFCFNRCLAVSCCGKGIMRGLCQSETKNIMRNVFLPSSIVSHRIALFIFRLGQLNKVAAPRKTVRFSGYFELRRPGVRGVSLSIYRKILKKRVSRVECETVLGQGRWGANGAQQSCYRCITVGPMALVQFAPAGGSPTKYASKANHICNPLSRWPHRPTKAFSLSYSKSSR